MQTLDETKQAIVALPDADFEALRLWIATDESPRRVAQVEVDKARLADAEALWAKNPDLKPNFVTGDIDLDGKATKQDLLKAYEKYKWSQPRGAHDAYPTRARVLHAERIWDNELDKLNVWEPGPASHGWRDVTDQLLATQAQVITPPEPERGKPYAPDMPVVTGDLLEYEGETYRVVQDHTTAAHWPPNAVASLYQRV